MKLNIENFENYAAEQGYDSGLELFEELGYDEEAYEEFAEGAEVDRDMLLHLYMELGTSDVIDFIDFDSYEWELNIDLFDEI